MYRQTENKGRDDTKDDSQQYTVGQGGKVLIFNVGCLGLIKDNILIPLHIPIWPMISSPAVTLTVLTFLVSLSVAPSGQFEQMSFSIRGIRTYI